MRIGIYGDCLALALIACAEVAESATQQPIWRSDVMFKSDQTEAFDVIVASDASFAAPGIAHAYGARSPAPPVFLVPQVQEKRELLASDAFRAYADHLGIALPTPEQLADELEAEAKTRAEAEAALGATPDAPPVTDPVAPVAEDTSVVSVVSDDVGDDASEPMLPKVADLAAHVATITDADALLDLMQRDTRKTAAPIYEARFAELTASPSA